jgi:integrase
MARKRANGEGSISKEKSGRYRISVSVKIGNELKRVTRTAWKHADAVAILQTLRAESMVAVYRAPHRIAVGTYLKQWLADSLLSRSDTTRESYRFACESHIIPRIGGVLLKSLEPIHIQHFTAEMIRDEVGTRTQQNAFTVLRAAIAKAVELKLIARDPFEHAEKPKHEPEPIFPFTLAEAKMLLSSTAGTRLHAMLHMAIGAGIRQGELLGLEWDRIDWQSSRVRIDQQVTEVGGAVRLSKPKTKASIRTVDLTSQSIDALRLHRQLMMVEGFGDSRMVFPGSKNGGIQNRGTFRVWHWNPLLVDLAIEHRGFHHTRHTYATLALGAGIPITVVSKQMGHAKVSTTLDIYSHVLDAHQTAATSILSRLLG